MTKQFELASPDATTRLGGQLAPLLRAGGVVYLYGDLGSGKTSLARAVLEGLGYQGRVKSPTYTLVEAYELDVLTVYHMDLYRLSDPEELEYLGVREMIKQSVLSLIEWPDHGLGYITSPDLIINLEYSGKGRWVQLSGKTIHGKDILSGISV